MSKATTEDQIERYNLELLQALGYGYQNGYDIEPEGNSPERQSFSDVLLKDRLQAYDVASFIPLTHEAARHTHHSRCQAHALSSHPAPS